MGLSISFFYDMMIYVCIKIDKIFLKKLQYFYIITYIYEFEDI